MSTTSSEPLLLTIQQTCVKLGISRATFYRLRSAGLVRVTTLPGRTGRDSTVRVHIEDVQECARRLREESAA